MPQGADLPLPVAVLVRRARNAKSPKDRHDTAYFAWEASVRLAVAARPPADVSPLVSASVGHWVGALQLGDVPLDAPALVEVCALFEEVALGERPTLRSVKPRRLVGTLPGYRNQVIGHGSTRPAAFYDGAAAVLLAGLDAAWAESVFMGRGSRLVYAQAVEIDPSGVRRARLLELSGDAARIVDPRGTRGIPDDMLPRRLYVSDGTRYQPLYPWVLFEEEELRERVLFFNGLRRRPAYLDYASGEALRGAELAEAFPGVEAEVFALFEQEPSEEPEPEEDDPDVFGDYRILGKLGEGGMGVVYLARQESLGRTVALKMLPAHAVDSPTAVARFRREVAALSRCEHRNVVKILASGTARGTHYYAMEYVEGADLGRIYEALASSEDFESAVSTAAEAVRSEKSELFEDVPAVPSSALATPRRPKDRSRQLAVAFRDAARGVHHLHDSGVIHRDIKPGNLMVTASDHRVVVMDLGLAAVADASRSITRDKGQILGTLRYMPPEQLQRNLLQVDHRADVYALGATFYELLCERAFFDGDSEARLIEQVLREEPLHPAKANPRLPDDLATVLRKATEKDPKLRYDSADALAEDLDAYLEGRAITARPPTLGYLLRLAIRRNKSVAATAAVAVIALVGVVAFFLVSLTAERDRVSEQRDRADRERERAVAAEVVLSRTLEDRNVEFSLFRARQLLEDEKRLWPAAESGAGPMREWVQAARALLETRPKRKLGGEGPQASGESRETALARRRALESLLSELARVESLVPSVQERLSRVERLEGATQPNAASWDELAKRLASGESKYEGLSMTPQFGLVPLGPNRTGYEEFALVDSGEIPERLSTGELLIGDETAIVFVLLPAGTFQMGSPEPEKGPPGVDLSVFPKPEPLHTVVIPAPFLLARHECTWAQWDRLTLGEMSPEPESEGVSRRRPVVNVSWGRCREVIRAYRLRLPSESEWEFGCRAGSRTRYSFGSDMTEVGKYAWCSKTESAPVGTRLPNAFGLHDVHGNVWEWCEDTLHDSYDYPGRPDDGSAWVDGGMQFRVVRGGGFLFTPEFASSAFRGFYDAESHFVNLGFRPARDVHR